MNTLSYGRAALPDAELVRLFSQMTQVRHLDTSAIAWQRQGILPGYAPMRGQEAAQVGSVAALDMSRDFVFPTYREMGAALAAGVDMGEYMATHKATWNGGMYDARETRVTPIQTVIGGSALHAVGWAHGQRLDAAAAGADEPLDLPVALVYLGDGASSQGDIHEAMNFAGVFETPTVFFVQNNGWAISVPTERQVAGGSVAARGAGYGIASIHVDGNDVEAVVQATRAAVAHARSGAGPAVVEAMTYRRGPHSTSDDPGRYRSLAEERRDGGVDPMDALRDRLLEAGALTAEDVAAIQSEAEAFEERVRADVQAQGPRPGAEMFEYVYQEMPAPLREQAAAWREESDHV
ncbi:thiamine pyrophosphate-dependent enzyme [Zhihengliuella salsuginis]|uniref:2-oxoisovalerate dehydrogenase subunit alpha n=1 Tax=Zhihengliuella salsuginis TaxID=578222 RepID=A0ABQ3GL86_9MICC|nr:thiamine pyrophosphate-dependent enzyme [Zhihengliuella salsuginis]GHD08369.1 3-methyl-2-oxobutanoate dehydrogenase subunit alpha [Zhihengliuella salsuginis]